MRLLHFVIASIYRSPIAKWPTHRSTVRTEDSPEIQYLKKRREALGGYLPARVAQGESLKIPDLETFSTQLKDSGDREISTTMAFVRILTTLLRDKNIGTKIVPIVPDESRTFGMEGMFRQIGIYSPKGQLYRPEDADQLMFYREDRKGQVLQEGINEAGAFCSWIAAGTAYSNHDINMIPFYIYYSMFGFQRVGDLAWAAGDMQTRGFLIGGTAGRTTLAGEGLQHQDGQSQVLASMIPNCVAYDPTYSYELAVIIQDGLRRMFAEQENVFFYITTMNENYAHPAMPKGVEQGILNGMYPLQKSKGNKKRPKVQLLGSGTILREVISASELLDSDFGVSADIWSVTSFNELARNGHDIERSNRLNPDKKPKQSYVEKCLAKQEGPVVAATDYVRAFADQIRAFVPNRYVVLGTDGYGRSDTRKQLRKFFEVDRYNIVLATLSALADDGTLPRSKVKQAIDKYSLDKNKPNPAKV